MNLSDMNTQVRTGAFISRGHQPPGQIHESRSFSAVKSLQRWQVEALGTGGLSRQVGPSSQYISGATVNGRQGGGPGTARVCEATP